MGAPYFKYSNQLKALNAVTVSSNYALYGDMSHRVMKTLENLAPGIEVYSIDEAWLNLARIPREKLDMHGQKIVTKTLQHTGIPVSVGIGPTRVLAKIANRICKQQEEPGNVFKLIDSQAITRNLADLPIDDVWGVGEGWAKRLRRDGIYSALDLRNVDPSWVRKAYGIIMQRIVLELKGQSCLEFEDIAPKKLIIASRSFGNRVTRLDDLLEAISFHATRAGEKLRKQHSVCNALQVFLKTGKYNPNESHFNASTLVPFPTPTADTRNLIRAAEQGIKTLFKQGHRYAKTGVMLLDISPAEVLQRDFFNAIDSERSQKLMKAVDIINQTRGKHTLFFASEGTRKSWAMKHEKRTHAYTTRWSEIPTVR